jgi:hypothetical protein
MSQYKNKHVCRQFCLVSIATLSFTRSLRLRTTHCSWRSLTADTNVLFTEPALLWTRCKPCSWQGQSRIEQIQLHRFWVHFLSTVSVKCYPPFLRHSSTLLFFPEGGVGLVHKRGCLLTLEYYAFPRWYEFGERWWNDIWTGENRRTRRKPCTSATLSTTNPTWIDPGANPSRRLTTSSTLLWTSGIALCSMSSRMFWISSSTRWCF